eukprot:13057653-Ditylum_brightwellii.AAC.1
MLAALDDVYSRAPKDATIISGEDINAKLGHNIRIENKDSTSPHPHHKITGPFSTHLHNNARAAPIAEKLAAHNLTSATTWYETKQYGTHFDNRNKEYAQLDHFFVTSSARKMVTACKLGRQLIQSDHLP